MLEVAVRGARGEVRIDAAFTVAGNEVTALFGRSGAGKTSVINMIAGLVRPEGGRIAIDGDALFDSALGIDLAPDRRRIGTIFQDARLFPHLSVRANLIYGMKLTPAADRYVDFDQVIGLFGIADLLDRRPASLSGGEKQRVAIGRALLASPRLLLMDEPLAGLDAERKNHILPFIERLHREIAVPIVYVSHALDEVLRIADTVALIADGHIEAVGPVEEVTNRVDLQIMTGSDQPDTVIAAEVEHHEPEFGLTHLTFPAGTLRLPTLRAAPGTPVRVRLRARDVSLARSRPTDISVLNIFSGTVGEIDRPDGAQGAANVAVVTDAGLAIWARITARAVHDLELRPGAPVHALIKSVAIDSYGAGGLGSARQPGRAI
ncbi:MAG: molybdenum ABC transporter ATP-binding protein [Alphaproteobacteria bacterium]|nr:molybdenum ABC transporter ATP-binding protein [Alphaproteobacteria bacterium]MDP6516967.1 molybdenum ABC transporter ATP-binding protein [Alphaproteobacteria bacterium]